ncbi:50S ribosomal subunit protein L4 [Erysipelotrichaceae bacterium]|nr:50S ribosomal subunit protein L4 [Erysipelotrichaceae bacterium]
MPKVNVYNLEGKKVSDIELSELVFGVEPHKQAMFDAIIMQQAALRQGTHKTKTRGEVRGGGKKPWRQKGTGRARQGSIRSPQWRGGGVVFGPQPRSYKMKMNKKVYQLALKSMYASKVLEGKLIVIDTIELTAPRTKTMIEVFNAFESKKPLIITELGNENLQLSVRNIARAHTLTSASTSVLDLANADAVIVTLDAIKKIEEVLG